LKEIAKGGRVSNPLPEIETPYAGIAQEKAVERCVWSSPVPRCADTPESELELPENAM